MQVDPERMGPHGREIIHSTPGGYPETRWPALSIILPNIVFHFARPEQFLLKPPGFDPLLQLRYK